MEFEVVDAASLPDRLPDDQAFVCLPVEDDPGRFPDNRRGPCARCGRTVIYRPYMAHVHPRLCVPCARTLIESQEPIDGL